MSLNTEQQDNVNIMYDCVDKIETLAGETFLRDGVNFALIGVNKLFDDCNAIRQSITVCKQEIEDVE